VPYSVESLRRILRIGYKKAKRVFDEVEGISGIFLVLLLVT
jgi:hypothetical protein